MRLKVFGEGLSVCKVADAGMPFVAGFVYAGLFLFYLGLAGSNSYRRGRARRG